MTRLTKAIREQMVSALLHHRFQDRGNSLEQEAADIFALVYNDSYDEQSQRLMKQLQKKHRDGLSHAKSISVNVLGKRISVGDVAIGIWGVLFDSISIEARVRLENWKPAYIDGPIADRITKFASDLEDFNQAIKRAHGEVTAALNSLTTAKMLQDQWPEAMPIIGKLIPINSSSLPALKFSKLSAEFHLSQEAQA